MMYSSSRVGRSTPNVLTSVLMVNRAESEDDRGKVTITIQKLRKPSPDTIPLRYDPPNYELVQVHDLPGRGEAEITVRDRNSPHVYSGNLRAVEFPSEFYTSDDYPKPKEDIK